MGQGREKKPQDGVEKGKVTPGWDIEGKRHPRMGQAREKIPQNGAG